MFFHPGDGFLYLGVGDGGHPYRESRGSYIIGGTDDPQRIDRDLLSGALRIDVDRRGGAVSHPIRRQPKNGRTQGYFVPSDNPWLDPAGGVLEEFWAIGLRNPHRMTHDPGTGRIFAGDVGEARVEEIDVVERGGNYQWSFLEGNEPYGRRPARVLGAEKGPLHAYPHRGFTSVIGGFVYRGRAFPELAGKYLYAENSTGQLFQLDAAASAPAEVASVVRLPQEMAAYGGVASLATDREGEVYLCVLGNNEKATGSLQRLVRAPAGLPPAPATLTQTRLFDDVGRLAPAGALFPYQVNAPFWSDHKVKTRWLFVPPGGRIGFRPEGDWTFPAGTIAVKHFDLLVDEREPGRRRRLETRVLVVGADGNAYGRTYKWRPDQREADLIAGPVTERLTMTSRAAFGPLVLAALAGEGRGAIAQGPEGRLTLRSPAGGTLFAHVGAGAGDDDDFDVAAAFGRVSGGTAGLMLRDGLETSTGSLLLAWEPAGAAGGGRLRVVQRRLAAKDASVARVEARGPWIRLRRQQGVLTAFTGEDGALWTEVAGVSLRALRGGAVGLAVSAESGVAEAEIAAHVRCETRDHYYPGNDECMACHTRSAHVVLGASTRQWNREVDAGGARLNQLVAASQRGLFDVAVRPAEPAGWKHLFALDDAAASLEERARSYLDANCSQCHRPGVVVQTGLDARFDTPLAKQGLLLGRPRSPSLPHPDELIVVPKDLERSRLYTRIRSRRMPPLGSVLPHQAGLDLIRDWIMSLDGPPALVAPAIAVAPAAAGRPARVILSHPDPGAVLHYTTDDSAPSPETPRYRGPLEVDGPTVVRAAAYREGFAPSRVVSREVDPAVTP
jgi:hypothetical protein